MHAKRNTGIMLTAVGGLAVGALVGGLMAGPPSIKRAPATDFLDPPEHAATLDPEVVEGAESVGQAFTAVADVVTPAVVRILAEQAGHDASILEMMGSDADPGDLPPVTAGGTGFLVSSDGTILTNNHVVEGARRLLVTLHDKRVFEAELVGRDPTTDVAVLRVPVNGLPAVKLGDSDAARVGEWVVAIGNPGFGQASTLDFTVTSGIISAKGRPLNIIPQGLRAEDPANAGYAIEDFIQTDAVINPGNSGGPLLNLRGEVIGINTAIASTTGFHQGYAFAIPVNLVRKVVRDLLEYGVVQRARLGVTITDITAEDAEVYRLPRISGVLVEDIEAGAPAAEAGMDRNDVIVGLDGISVDHVGQLQRVVAQRSPGDVVEVSVIRYGDTRTFQITLAQAPLAEPLPPAVADGPAADRQLGLSVADMSERQAAQYGLDEADGSVLVTAVARGTAAALADIRRGDRIVLIDRRAPGNANSVRGLLDSLPRGRVVSFLLQEMGGRTRIANVRIP